MGSLTQLQRSIIIGTLLGDGHLRIVRGRKNALLEINHGFLQKEYVDWKYSNLANLSKNGPVIRNSNDNRIAYRFTTRQHTELTDLHNYFYVEGRKIIPHDLKIDPMMLAVWYMDDGSKCRESDVYLNTQQFSLEDQNQCVLKLKEIGIESSLNKDKKYFRVRIKKSSLPIFWEIITPHVIPSMYYKLRITP